VEDIPSTRILLARRRERQEERAFLREMSAGNPPRGW